MEKIETIKNFVRAHQTALVAAGTVAVTAAVCIAMNKSALAQRDTFLKEHDLLEKFTSQIGE